MQLRVRHVERVEFVDAPKDGRELDGTTNLAIRKIIYHGKHPITVAHGALLLRCEHHVVHNFTPFLIRHARRAALTPNRSPPSMVLQGA